MKDDPQEAASQLFRSVSGDHDLLIEAHAHYSELLRAAPDDIEARRVLTLVEWALTGTTPTGPVVIRAKKASAAG